MRQHVENQRHRINMLTQQVHDKDDTITDYGKRFKRLEVFPVGEKGGCGGGGTDLQILGFQMGVEVVQKTL